MKLTLPSSYSKYSGVARVIFGLQQHLFDVRKLLSTLTILLTMSSVGLSQSLALEYQLTTRFLGNVVTETYSSLASPLAKVDTLIRREVAHASTRMMDPELQTDPFIAIDYTVGQNVYTATYFNRERIVKDNIVPLQYVPHDSSRVLLSLPTKMAKVKLGGRDYTVWYTEKLGLLGGIHKFFGLPGYVLAADSDDGLVSMRATKISMSPQAVNYAAFVSRFTDTLTYAAYREEFQEWLEDTKRYLRSMEDEETTYELNVGLVELIEE